MHAHLHIKRCCYLNMSHFTVGLDSIALEEQNVLLNFALRIYVLPIPNRHPLPECSFHQKSCLCWVFIQSQVFHESLE